MQSFDLSEGELRHVLDHLGHTLNIHKVHYRALSPAIERLTIAKMLLVSDKGLMSKYQGKTIEDIPLAGKLDTLEGFCTYFKVYKFTIDTIKILL